ncbi:hypothetical protein PNOK_0295900 [Pyrrhoderma noxium]|uniref:Uncharacterized protein n=1 Tax=Pyrrhoderma noxium TaxID=2282107 RepID=A0A286UL88_9AGAM|nr:hypothetical protein PNOK_0295900 [Pyrrhoderma noxium]
MWECSRNCAVFHVLTPTSQSELRLSLAKPLCPVIGSTCAPAAEAAIYYVREIDIRSTACGDKYCDSAV